MSEAVTSGDFFPVNQASLSLVRCHAKNKTEFFFIECGFRNCVSFFLLDDSRKGT